MTKTERSRDTITKVIQLLVKDEAVKLMWEQVEPSERKKVIDAGVVFLETQFEEYGGSRPLEPTSKVILIYPDWIWDRDLHLKDKTTGALRPVKLVFLDGERKEMDMENKVNG